MKTHPEDAWTLDAGIQSELTRLRQTRLKNKRAITSLLQKISASSKKRSGQHYIRRYKKFFFISLLLFALLIIFAGRIA